MHNETRKMDQLTYYYKIPLKKKKKKIIRISCCTHMHKNVTFDDIEAILKELSAEIHISI